MMSMLISPFARVTCPGVLWVGDLLQLRNVFKTDKYSPAERGKAKALEQCFASVSKLGLKA